jgi:ribonuclease BN (tRNA processing enzyme)
VELTVLGCAGSYAGPSSPCSGYLLRSESGTTVWLDAGNGTFGHLQQHVEPENLDAVVLTHEHPDHCADLFGLHVLNRYGLERNGLPVYAPEGLEDRLGALVGGWGATFEWNELEDDAAVGIGDLAFRFSRTDHPPPTFAVEASEEGRRFVYTADTGPGWSVDAFGPNADLVLSEATYSHEHRKAPIHLSARDAGSMARSAGADRLVLTHLWPRLDPSISLAEGSEAFGAPVTLAAPHLVTRV